MMTLEIRLGRSGDEATVAEFNRALGVESERLELDVERLRQGAAAVLADPAKGFYLIAESGGEIVGQLLITYEWSDWRNGVFWWVQSVYVRPEVRGRGIYRRLYEEVLRRSREQGDVCGVRLYVERDNERAKKAYTRMGMAATAYEMWEEDFVLKR